jgi:hypothetical protein
MADLPYIQQRQEVSITGQDSTGDQVFYVGADTNGNMFVKDYATSATGSAVPTDAIYVGGKNPSGNLTGLQTLTTGELFVRDVLNVAGQNRAQSVTGTATEALGGATILANRKVIIMTPTNGTIYWGFTSGVTTTTGMPIYQSQTYSIAATDNLPIYVISAGTVNVVIAEAS